MSQVCIVRVDQRVSAIRAVEVPVFVYLRSSCNHVTELAGPLGLLDSRLMTSCQMTATLLM